MQHHHPAGRQAGFTFAELAFGLLILVIAAVVLVNHLTINYQTTLSERDRVFAYGKAQAMLSEIQGFVDRGNVDAAWDLDVLDDGVVIGRGTHDELIKDCPTYAEIVQSQIGEKDAA